MVINPQIAITEEDLEIPRAVTAKRKNGTSRQLFAVSIDLLAYLHIDSELLLMQNPMQNCVIKLLDGKYDED